VTKLDPSNRNEQESSFPSEESCGGKAIEDGLPTWWDGR
jgi:hypothetical protein